MRKVTEQEFNEFIINYEGDYHKKETDQFPHIKNFYINGKKIITTIQDVENELKKKGYTKVKCI